MFASLIDQFVDFICGLDPQQWFLVLVAAVIVGFLFLRGFGSRSGY